MAMSRSKKYTLRSALHQAELMIPRADHSKQAEKERDLLSESAVALWNGNIAKLWGCLRRLAHSPERAGNYLQIMPLLNS